MQPKTTSASRMNISLVLLVTVVGVLFLAGSTDAQRLTVSDVEGAIDYIWKTYLKMESKDIKNLKSTTFGYELSDGTKVSVSCDMYGKRFDCGFPLKPTPPNKKRHELYLSELKELQKWFPKLTKKTIGGTGVIENPQQKYTKGIWVANAQYYGKLYDFNFHIPVNMKSKRLSFLKLLLARALLKQ